MVVREGLSVLMVEDDARLASFVSEFLAEHGVMVRHVLDGNAALHEAFTHDFDAILLDWMLPGMQGPDVCRRIRSRKDTPIIIITARQEEAERVLGLELGADDYVIKPFSSRELLARIRAHVRRASGSMLSERSIRVGTIELHVESRRCSVEGNDVDLTANEFELLRTLAVRRNRVVTRETLIAAMKGDTSLVFDRAIDVAVSRLRGKLEKGSNRLRLLRTVRGVGYMLADSE